MLEGYGPSTYGDRIADIYDELHQQLFSSEGAYSTEETVSSLADLAHGGRVLELGIGTGRIAIPLAERGIEVHGIDASKAMVAKLHAKPKGKGVPVTLGDFAEVRVRGKFSLIFVVFNTFFALDSQEAQVRCFRNAARHLADDGLFVLQTFVPDLTRYTRGQTTQTSRLETGRVMLDVSRHDPVQQQVTTQHILITEAGTRLYPGQIRYAWPSELDLMAQLAGLCLRNRWGDWRGSLFTAASTAHISVYERA